MPCFVSTKPHECRFIGCGIQQGGINYISTEQIATNDLISITGPTPKRYLVKDLVAVFACAVPSMRVQKLRHQYP